MTQTNVEAGLLIDEIQLTLDEFARACRRDAQWVRDRIDAELICAAQREAVVMQFSSADLIRARRLASVEAMFEANEDVAGLVVDLIEEVERLRKALVLAKLR
jgi:chaperone modulatory protein CbpM